jgi:outer membrane lipoprotein LolB
MKFCWKRWRATAPFLTAKTKPAAALVFILGLIGGGCASVGAPSPVLPEAEKLAVFFAVSGSVAARDEDEKTHLAGFRWRRQRFDDGGFADTVYLEAPPGQAFARITVAPGKAALRTSRREYRAADAEALMLDALGWRLPIAGLGHWIIGAANPNAPHEMRFAVDGLAREIVQDGWRIAFAEYGEDRLPRKIALSRGGFSADIAIAKWRILPPR